MPAKTAREAGSRRELQLRFSRSCADEHGFLNFFAASCEPSVNSEWDDEAEKKLALENRSQLSASDEPGDAREILIHDAVFLHDRAHGTNCRVRSLQRS